MAAHALKHLEDVFLLHEGHLAVNLRELGLAVGTQVFIAEALADLEVAVNACHHAELLERLRTLGQGIELAGIHAARYDKVAGSFGRAVHENGRLNLQEALLVKVAAHLKGKLVAEFKVAAHGAAADVQIAVLHAQVIAAIGIFFNGEGRRVGGVEHGEFAHIDFDVACGHLVVLGVAFGHHTFHLQDVFASQFVGALAKGGVSFFVEYELGDAVSVAQVDKGHTTHFAATLHPACKGNALANVRNT